VKHVYLSPHLDDAVLSCGGVIHRQVVEGDSVLVLTILAGEGPATLSAFALLQHAYWGNPRQPLALRRAEDVAALTVLGAEWYHLGYLDAVYRAAGDRWLYADLEALFGPVKPGDPLALAQADLVAQLAGFLAAPGTVTVYAPLAVGGHVDHRIVNGAALRLAKRGYRVAFYEDYPYASQAGSVEAAGVAGWRPELLHLDVADVAAWVKAAGYYRSQLGVLFRGADAMPSLVWTFASTRRTDGALAGRIWWPDGE
jgi:LmbE family N-acetylglucosaminyl deacetylase